MFWTNTHSQSFEKQKFATMENEIKKMYGLDCLTSVNILSPDRKAYNFKEKYRNQHVAEL